MARNELERATWNKNMSRPVTTSLRRSRVDALKEKIARGEGTLTHLTQEDGTQFFVNGQCPMDDPFVVY